MRLLRTQVAFDLAVTSLLFAEVALFSELSSGRRPEANTSAFHLRAVPKARGRCPAASIEKKVAAHVCRYRHRLGTPFLMKMCWRGNLLPIRVQGL